MAEYISKADVIKKIAEDHQDRATSGIEDVTYYRAIKIIRDMPAADVQPIEIGKYTNLIKALDMSVSYLRSIYRNREEEREMVAIMVAVEVLTKLNGGEQE